MPRHRPALAIIALLAAAPAISGESPLGCRGEHYAAVYAPWTDEHSEPQLWIVPARAPASGDWGVTVRTVPLPGISDMVCRDDALLLRGRSSVFQVAMAVGQPGAAEVAHGAPWHISRADKRSRFRINKARIVTFGKEGASRVVVARTETGPDGNREWFTAVILASLPVPPTRKAVTLFTRYVIEVTLD